MEAKRTPAMLVVVAVVCLSAGFLLGFLAGSRDDGGTEVPGRSAAGREGGSASGAQEEGGGPAPDADGRSGAGPGTGGSAAGGGASGGTATGTDAGNAAASAGGAAGALPPGRSGGTARTDRSGPSAPGAAVRTGAPPAYELPARIAVTLVDARTGKPIPGATVSLLYSTSDGTQSGGIDVPLGEDGSFAVDPSESMKALAEEMFKSEFQRGKFASAEEAFRDLEYRLRVAAKGYVTHEKGDPGDRHEVSLEPEARDRLYGTVRVEALWPDDSRYAGRLLVNVSSHDRGAWSQWSLPEPDGAFLLCGIPGGTWSFNVAGKRNTGTDVAVLEGAESRVTLRVPRRGVEEPSDAPAGEAREVEVSTGSLETGPGACMRAECRPGLFHRVEVLSGRALFAALPAGKWEFVLQAPDRPEVRFPAEVPAGSGRLALRFPELPR